MTKNDKTHFGFQEVNYEDKQNLVGKVFSNVATKYDLMNDLMSAGIHRLWKDKMMKEVEFHANKNEIIKFIDVAGGTADIALRLVKKAKKNKINYEIDIVDINENMLKIGKERMINDNLFLHSNFVCANGESLPYPDSSFDFFTIAFGIRNFTNIDKGLEEAYRVLKKGGKFICLEFSKVNNYFLQKAYNLYSFKVIPKIGEIVLNDKDSYQYLVESINKFPSQDNFAKMIENCGFKNVKYQNLNGGIAAIHVGYKI